ncbi:MAG: oligosaccharide flippase family protein [Gammaproteobacteria bacterium]|nr:oligosaccharide flippase family protein [Gammaproteobacteria bacterium]MBU1722908.1 oligosaccharide flippase family protein [Gammaproteobacteria bacterium]MBU2005715.1 oligosaccharide flippase family protein [Gammaproteobacteria bacterium]
MSTKSPSLLLTSIVSTIARFAGVGLNFAVAIVLTRNLPMDEAGMVFMLMTLVTGVSLFSRLGVEQWLVRDVARIHDGETDSQGSHLRDAYRMVLLSSAVFIVLWLIVTPLLQHRLFDDAILMWPLLLAGSGILFFNLVMLNSAFMKAVRHTSQSILIQNSLPAVAYMLLILLFWKVFTQQQNYLLLYIASLVLAGLWSFYWLRPWWKNLHPAAPIQFSIRDVLKQSLPLAPVSFFSFLMLWADTLLTGLLLSNEDVALFTVAARLSFVSLFFLGALDATIYPRLLKIHKHQPEQVVRFFWQTTGLVAGILGVVTLLLLVAGDVLLKVFRPEYVQAGTALVILLIAQFVRAMSLTFSFMFIIQEQVRYLNIMLMSALVVNIIANLVFIPQYGIEGAAGATLLANLVLTGGVMILFFRNRLLIDQGRLL